MLVFAGQSDGTYLNHIALDNEIKNKVNTRKYKIRFLTIMDAYDAGFEVKIYNEHSLTYVRKFPLLEIESKHRSGVVKGTRDLCFSKGDRINVSVHSNKTVFVCVYIIYE